MKKLLVLLLLCGNAWAADFFEDKYEHGITTISTKDSKAKPLRNTYTEEGDKRALDVNVTGGTSPEVNTSGATQQFEDQVAGVAVVSYPSTAGEDITSFIMINEETKIANSIDFSLDGGVTYTEIKGGGFIGWSPKGGITQIFIKRGGSVDADFELIINTKAP